MSAAPDDAARRADSIDDASDAILHEVLEDMDSDSGVDVADLRRRFPDHVATVERLCRVASEYRVLRGTMSMPSAELAALRPGTTLGDFEIESLLARGGMGVVYRARQLSLGGRRVALKVQAVDDLAPHMLTRFRREALAAAELHHAHLAEVYGFGTEGQRLYYAMRLVDGPSLRDVLERLALDSTLRVDPQARRRLVAMVVNIAAALEIVHDAGLVHRDVKPSNILLQAESSPRGSIPEAAAILVDFGLVRAVAQHTRTEYGAVAATPSYASPEQLLGSDTDARSDVFSLGATLHDLLSARLPSERLQAAHGLEPLRGLDPSIDEDLGAIVAKATELDARWRYANGRELRLDLQRWLDGEPVLARRISIAERARRWVQRNPALILRGAALAALIGTGVWCVAEVVHFVSLHAQANTALAAGDIATLVDSLRALPPLPVHSLSGDSQLVQLRSRVDSGDDALPQMRDAIARGDAATALVIAATRLRTAEADSDKPLARWLAAQILRPTGGNYRARDRLLATVLCARLLFERPSLGAFDSSVGAELREALLQRFTDESTESFEQLYALSALGNCATPAQLAPIVAWTAKQSPICEGTRLGLMAVESVVRRTLASGHQDELQYDEVWNGLAPHLVALLAREREGSVYAPMHKEVTIAAIRMRRTLVLAQRASREAAHAAANLASIGTTVGLVALDRASSCEPLALPIEWMIVTGDTARIARWESESSVRAANWQPDCVQLGWGVGAMLDAELIRLAREVVQRRAGGDPVVARQDLDMFDAHVSRGISECSGESAELAPDADTLLGAPLPDFRPLLVTSSRELESTLALARYLPLSDPSKIPSFAQWELRTEPAIMSGAARALDGLHVEWRREGLGGYLRFGRFGTSEARFEFELNEECAFEPLDLCILHQLGARSHFPSHGSVLLEIEVDGGAIAVLSIPTVEPVLSTLRVPHTRLATGRHVVRVRQLESSTTTYRLLWLGLRTAKQ